jgi:hypothetical protein
MARNRKRKALYEVVGKAWSKSSPDKTLERPEPAQIAKDGSIKPQAARLSEKMSMWPRKPRIFQLHAGRLEISIPYEVAVALLLGAILLLLVVFRIGQSSSTPDRQLAVSEPQIQPAAQPAVLPATELTQPPDTDEEKIAAALAERIDQPEQKGDNRIVIQTYQLRPHLEPVKQYFARFGIETEIQKVGDWYYLVTLNKYENPERPGTDGYDAKQRIIELGAAYKAPLGYETFGDKPFHDAYGKRFEE